MVDPSGRYNTYKHTHTKDRAPKYIKQDQTELKGDIANSKGIAEDLNTPLSAMDRMTGQKINKDIKDLSNTINQLYLADTYRILHPTTTE